MGGKLLLILPHSSKPEKYGASITHDFALNHRCVEFLDIPVSAKKPKSWWKDRDRRAVEVANILLPVSVDPRGSLSKLIANSTGSKQIINDFVCPYKIRARSLGRSVSPDDITFDFGENWNYLVHWTSSSNGPWPNETSADFYRSIIESDKEYSHSALNTLINILKAGTIYGSSEHIKGKHRCVGFTGLPPAEAIQLMRLRRRYMRYSFEPFGIAIEKESAKQLGIRPVIYGTSQEYSRLSSDDQLCFQSEGRFDGQWRNEHEHRYVGHFDLRKIPDDQMAVIVRDESQIERVRNHCSCSITALTGIKSAV